ncbi:ParB N-terminal domain-containing protein [Chloroflexales bacterium ZM16-3]|nr:ParB N-terminal domain-containing protein [Chloroflexales bacterium ZM16-3]
MPPKPNEKMRELRERAAAMMNRPAVEPAPESQREAAPDQPSVAAADTPAAKLNAHFGIAALDQVAQGRAVQRLPLAAISPEQRPEARQARLLPPPEDLLIQGLPNPAYADLVASLLDLGRSIQDRQIQPIMVYPDESAVAPAARYHILVGHRRWTAARLIGMAEIDAVVVDPPSAADRVRIQYAENEERVDFSDMERVWALQQMKQALGDAPWDAVEERFQMSRGRRQELLRLATFTADQQVQVARLRLRETQLRPLHAAARAGELQPAHVDTVLAQLGRLIAPADEAAAETRPQLDGPTIARVVARAKRTASSTPPAPTPRWVLSLQEQLGRVDAQVARTRPRFHELRGGASAQLRAHLEATARRLHEALKQLPQDETTQADPDQL